MFTQFIQYSNKELENFDFTPCYKVDFIIHGNDIKGSDIIDIAELNSIWGQGIEQPLIVIKDLNITKNNVTLLSKDKNPTLKITLQNGISMIKFKSSEEEYESLCSEEGCVTIDVVGKCDINEWNGKISPQLKIEDYEIVGIRDYYF